MKTFKYFWKIPDDFTGTCKIIDWKATVLCKNGYIHSEDGPAIIHDNGTKEWRVEGKYHRLDGPAIEFLDSTDDNTWFVDGNEHTEQEYWGHPKVIQHKLEKILNDQY